MTGDFIVVTALGLCVGICANAIVQSFSTTISDLEKDPEKLEQFYQETKAAQIKAAAEKVKAAAEELKRAQEPVKITSATRPSDFAQFKIKTMV